MEDGQCHGRSEEQMSAGRGGGGEQKQLGPLEEARQRFSRSTGSTWKRQVGVSGVHTPGRSKLPRTHGETPTTRGTFFPFLLSH